MDFVCDTLFWKKHIYVWQQQCHTHEIWHAVLVEDWPIFEFLSLYIYRLQYTCIALHLSCKHFLSKLVWMVVDFQARLQARFQAFDFFSGKTARIPPMSNQDVWCETLDSSYHLETSSGDTTSASHLSEFGAHFFTSPAFTRANTFPLQRILYSGVGRCDAMQRCLAPCDRLASCDRKFSGCVPQGYLEVELSSWKGKQTCQPWSVTRHMDTVLCSGWWGLSPTWHLGFHSILQTC